MYEGSCLCGTVRYRVTGGLGPIVQCHCRQCRKAQGTAFATNAPVAAEQFLIVAGEDALRIYESSPGKERVFCGNCGSPLISRRGDRPQTVRLRLGTLDTPIDQRPTAHIYAAHKAEWDEILDRRPAYPEREPGR